MPSYAYREGQLVKVPDLVISESCDLHEAVNRTLIIEGEAEVTSYGPLNGMVELAPGTVLDARGTVNGAVNVAREARATFHGSINGLLRVNSGGRARLARTAAAYGTMVIDGILINEGARGVQVGGSGVVDDRPSSTVRQSSEARRYSQYLSQALRAMAGCWKDDPSR